MMSPGTLWLGRWPLLVTASSGRVSAGAQWDSFSVRSCSPLSSSRCFPPVLPNARPLFLLRNDVRFPRGSPSASGLETRVWGPGAGCGAELMVW